MVEGVRNADAFVTGSAQFSLSDSGSLVYIPGQVAALPQYQLGYVDRSGSVKPLGLPLLAYADLRLSPDGRQLAFAVNDGKEQNVWVYELSGASSMRRLTFGGSLNHDPVWSEDGERILFRSNREGDIGVFWQRADGAGAPERLLKPDSGVSGLAPESWVPRDQRFFFVTVKGGDFDVWIYSLQDKKASPVIVVPSSAQNVASISPDGRWLAYESDETGRMEIYVQPFPGTGGKFQITKDGGTYPLWSRDGKELFYLNLGRLFSVAFARSRLSDSATPWHCRYPHSSRH